MTKELKRKTNVIDVDQLAEQREQKNDDLIYQSEVNIGSNFSPIHWDELLDDLRKKNLLYESYEEFLKSEKNKGCYVERRENGSTMVYIKADSIYEANDQLVEMGFLNQEQCDVMNRRLRELEDLGVDIETLPYIGFDTFVYGDDQKFEEFRNDVLKAHGLDVPETKDTAESSLTDDELLAKLADVEREVGLSGPDAVINQEHDIEVG